VVEIRPSDGEFDGVLIVEPGLGTISTGARSRGGDSKPRLAEQLALVFIGRREIDGTSSSAGSSLSWRSWSFGAA
jgi:hypothetical protein